VQAILRHTGKPLIDFMLPFGDFPKAQPVTQSVEYQEMVLDAWIKVSNAMQTKGR
jgi:hypothetical protein